MPYDEHLAQRIRTALRRTPNVTEKPMMGGVCFMVDDKMCINATRAGDVMQRCLSERTEELEKRPGVSKFVMNGKPLQKGWLRISPEAVDTDDDLQFWIGIALEGNKAAKPKGRHNQ